MASKGPTGVVEMGIGDCAKALGSLLLHGQHLGKNKHQRAPNHRADPNLSPEPLSASAKDNIVFNNQPLCRT